MFDAVTPAVVAADLIVSSLLVPDRAARLVEQRVFDATQPGLEGVIDAIFAATAPSASHTAHEAEVQRAIERVALDGVMELAEGAGMPQVRAIATLRLRRRSAELAQVAGAAPAAPSDAATAHATLLAADIRRFLERPAGPAVRMATPSAPPGAPIGEPAMEWLRRIEPPCSWWYEWQW